MAKEAALTSSEAAQKSEYAQKAVEKSLSLVSILNCNINDEGHLIVSYQHMEGFSVNINRNNGHLLLEV